MKVLQIIPSFGVGGAEKVVLNYLRIAKRKGLDFTAISLYPRTGSIYDEIIVKENLNVIYLNKRLGMDFGVVKELKKTIKSLKPDVVHTHLYVSKYYILTGVWRKCQNFHTIHNTPSPDANGVDYWANKFMFNIGKSIPVVLHDKLASEVENYYRVKNARVIGNGIFLDDYKNKGDGSSLRMSLGISDDDFVIGNVGRFKYQKNHVFMLDILKDILRQRNEVKLLLVGDGELRAEIRDKAVERGVLDHIIFTGDRSDIPELLSIMDVFLFPSLFEGLGIVAIEAQVAGVRCVASDMVPKAACVSEGMEFYSLDEPISVWSEAILSGNNGVHLNENIKNYDIEFVIEDLMDLYGKTR